ncbi:MAG TPA: hypothetical protein VG711_11605, partial [Phycisphaerales bacterium]|nr:hypothetical protein [Phycisphaerales bacterium]
MLALAIAAVTFAMFSPALRFGPVNFDDPAYFSENVHVRGGITGENVRWAFTTTEAANWHPLTWISLMLDAQMGGDAHAAAVIHGTNMALHAVAAALIFLLVNSLTGNRWWSLLGTLVFALHPLRVESVAWISERKDVLSMVFALLTLLAYVAWAQRSGAWRMWMTVGFFALGLMAKPMLVSLPGLMLMLDAWPLKRWRGSKRWGGADSAAMSDPAGHGERSLVGLLSEKWALIVLTAASCVVTVYAQKAGGAVRSLETLPVSARVINSGMSVWTYLYQTVWPSGLAVFYPMHRDLQMWMGIAAWGGVGVVTALAWMKRNRTPSVLIGWLWYLWTLLPVIGLMQVGLQAHADRYTYLPTIGLV